MTPALLMLTTWLQAAPAAAAGPDMVAIPGGCLEIGCVGEQRCQKDLAAPFRRVCLSPYRIDRSEVTVGDYRRCVEAGACKPLAPATDGQPPAPDPTRDRHPVTGVTWEQADAYCRAQGKRLPTEAEWERAAVGPRGDGRAYPWGTEPPRCEHAVLEVPAVPPTAPAGPATPPATPATPPRCPDDRPADRPFTRPVCSRPAGNSPEGVCDLLGNAAEWVSDHFVSAASKRGATGTNPRGPCPGQKRCPGSRGHIIKGGGWSDSELFSRIHNRPPAWKPFVTAPAGIRCAASSKSDPPKVP
jgi:formylglycine-generating enzyme